MLFSGFLDSWVVHDAQRSDTAPCWRTKAGNPESTRLENWTLPWPILGCGCRTWQWLCKRPHPAEPAVQARGKWFCHDVLWHRRLWLQNRVAPKDGQRKHTEDVAGFIVIFLNMLCGFYHKQWPANKKVCATIGLFNSFGQVLLLSSTEGWLDPESCKQICLVYIDYSIDQPKALKFPNLTFTQT